MREQMDNAGEERFVLPALRISSVPGQGQVQVHMLQHSPLSSHPTLIPLPVVVPLYAQHALAACWSS